MTWFILYVFVIADQLREALSIYGGLTFITSITTLLVVVGSAMYYFAISDYTDDEEEITRKRKEFFSGGIFKYAKNMLICMWGVVFLTFTLHTLIPTQKNLAILIGAGVTYEAVTSEEGKRIGGKLIDLLEQKIDESLGGEVIELPKAKVSGKEI